MRARRDGGETVGAVREAVRRRILRRELVPDRGCEQKRSHQLQVTDPLAQSG